MSKKRNLIKTISLSSFIFLLSCAAQQLNPGAQLVKIGTEQPGKECKYMGEVVGGQGGSFTGAFTSNVNLEEGAKNDLKNKAAAIGANFIQLLTNRAGSTGSGGGYQGGGGGYGQTNVVYVGACYKCPE